MLELATDILRLRADFRFPEQTDMNFGVFKLEEQEQQNVRKKTQAGRHEVDGLCHRGADRPKSKEHDCWTGQFRNEGET